MHCNSKTVTENYVPAPLGNGELSVQINMEGEQKQKPYCGMIPGIWWAGRRYNTSCEGELIPYGYFLQNKKGLKYWEQSLNVQTASTSSTCNYEDGQETATEAFVHLNHPILAIRKRFSGRYNLRYYLAQPGEEKRVPERMDFISTKNKKGVDISYQINGLPQYNGLISFWTDCDKVQVDVNHNEFSITVLGESASFYIAFMDALDHDDCLKAATELKMKVKEEGFDRLFKSHKQSWSEYWSESYVKLPSQKQQEVYETSQYHLRISSTRWSIPMGVFPSHWHARYFSFDDFFSLMGLLTSGHISTAKKIPEFRFQLLEKARSRAHEYFKKQLSGARYSWEQLEDGREATPPGFWLEHIFHMAHIALSAWYYYRYSGDDEFLRQKAYPVIANCADFYQVQSVYKLGDDQYIVGKCTDLERLGPGRENAFMTTCGVIATFEAAAKCADLLGVDEEKAEEWRFYAEKLRQSLPCDHEKYIPYPECEQKSIAVFTGTYPYQVLSSDDTLQKEAISDYLKNEDKFGNMYPVGNSVCVWYAAWKGVAFARMGQIDNAVACIEQASSEANCFSEIFEISNPVHRPWFTTAEGAYINMVNESLLQSSENEIKIIALNSADCSFKLPAVGGVTVEVEMKNKKIIKLVLYSQKDYNGKIITPNNAKSIDITLKANSVTPII